MEIPTSTELRQESNVGFEEAGYGAPVDGETDRMDLVIREAVADFHILTGISVRAIDDDPDEDARNIPVRKAIRMLVEFAIGSSQPSILETAYDFDMVGSMSVTGYSETRREVTNNLTVLHPWPALNRLLRQIQAAGADGSGGGSGAYGSGESPAIGIQPLHPRPGTDVIRDQQHHGVRVDGMPWGW